MIGNAESVQNCSGEEQCAEVRSHAWPQLLIQSADRKPQDGGLEEITEVWSIGLVVQDYAEEAIIDRDIPAVVVLDKAMLFELIHEMTDP